METLVGRWWHRAISHLAQQDHPQAAVSLSEVQKSIGILFRAGGGAACVRVTTACAQRVGGARSYLQRLAGSGTRATLAQLEPTVLALPPSIALFEARALNHDLYLWLALLSGSFVATGDWFGDNQRASRAVLEGFPGFTKRYEQLCRAHLAQRPAVNTLKLRAATAEARLQAALRGFAQVPVSASLRAVDVAPVWLWLNAAELTSGALPALPPTAAAPATHPAQSATAQRRHAEHCQAQDPRQALVLPFRGEALMSWSERVHVNRSADDEADGNAVRAADDMDKLSIAPAGQTLAARVKFDLDLPSASADDVPLGAGLQLPEWDYRQGVLRPAHCCVQEMQTLRPPDFKPPASLQQTARRLRRQLETLRDVPRAQHGQDSGDEIDLDAWVRFQVEQLGQAGRHSDTPAIYLRRNRHARSLATLLLADLSISTDAYATDQARIIDVIRAALFVFGEALSASGDAFAMWGFSSVRRQQVRLQRLKSFADAWNELSRARVGAIKPGYYTRMGAALRHATQELSKRTERRRLLMLLTDGKPNDLDLYEGRYGLEDTRHAVQQARAAGLVPFCVTVDAQAHDYLPLLFGQSGYTVVRRPQELVKQLTRAWATISAS